MHTWAHGIVRCVPTVCGSGPGQQAPVPWTKAAPVYHLCEPVYSFAWKKYTFWLAMINPKQQVNLFRSACRGRPEGLGPKVYQQVVLVSLDNKDPPPLCPGGPPALPIIDNITSTCRNADAQCDAQCYLGCVLTHKIQNTHTHTQDCIELVHGF